MLPCPQGDCFTVKYGRDVHSYIVGTERKGNQKERKKNIEPAAKKRSSMYKIVGREGVKALRSEKWQEAWEARR